ncbi:DUF664 domain-containing protein [Mucilaginibacter conchicola]|uniref:DUF664 domain-containing protein n=1 Tax=Mucilaginibacter conchicola TaxID=2303333 RepID=A0A372NZ33_9SPHI|nr:DinB family protein [Mucilaginibacter conchicola]RFZ94787.1 DUF664 domain-containing protein [Mucilaginibacter conchicola]
MHTTLLHQYRLVLSSRETLFDYCEGISRQHFCQQVPQFNNESMCSMMAHAAATYLNWLVNFAQREKIPYFESNDCRDIRATRAMFNQINIVVNDFLDRFKDALDVPLTLPKREGVELTLTPLDLFMHVITHEFHHKGQLVNMSRQLGYIPVDTDVIRS